MKKHYIFTFLAMLLAGMVNAQIVQVTDINATGDAGITGPPTAFNGELFFEADDGSAIGDELYKIAADGSVVLVKDINVDPDDLTSPNGDPKNFIEYNGKLYFAGNDGDNGVDYHDTELWVTDGTTDGTMMVEDAWVGGGGNALNPQQMFVFNGKLYFNGKIDGANQVFRYDGVNPITQITTWRDNGSAVPFFPCVDEANGKTYIKAIAANGKYNLGVLNADETSLMIVVNSTANIGFAGTEAGVIYKDKYYFNGDNGTDGDELFVSDGTEAGTTMLKDINVGGDSDPEQFTEYNGDLYFIAEVSTGMQLWKTDGTTDGTVMVAEPNVGGDADMDYLTLYNGKLYFAATEGTNGVEVWTYDGTTATMLKDLNADPADSNPEGFKEVDGLLFFAADDAGVNGERLFVTDGTEAGTLPVDSLFLETELPEDVDFKEFVAIGSKLYFTGDDDNGDDIFMIDVKTIKELVNQVTDINATGDAGITGPPTAFNGELFFEADDGSAIGDELYKIAADGSVVLVKDINVDPDDLTSPNGDPKNFIEYNGKLYFAGNDGDNGVDYHDTELWVTDGTTDGTMMVEDAWVGGGGNALNPQQMFVFNGKLYFNGKIDGANQVFRYDGVNPITQITTWRDNGSAVPFFPCVDEANGKTYIKAIAANGKYNLGVLNADETSLMIVVNSTANIGFAGTEAGVIYKDKYYFNGDNGTDGDELFVSDGTEAGTTMLKDINVGGDSDPEQFTEYNGDLYFIAEVSTGMQLWKTDGTTDGTVMVAEPNVGGDADMDFLTLYNGKLYFAATEGTNGVEVWTYDGTTATMLKDLNADPADSNPEGFKEVDGLLFFAADDAPNKEVLWVTNGDADYTMPVSEAKNSSVYAGYDIDYKEFAVIGTVLYYTGDDANGDEIFSVDAKKIWAEHVTFTVTDANGALEGATVAFAGDTVTTDASGMVTFEYVRMGADQAYTVSMEDYESIDGTVSVMDAPVSEDVVLVMLPTYNVTFTVTDGTNALEGALISFNEMTGTTDASGEYVFAEVLPAADMAYTITLDGYEDVAGTATVVDQDVSVSETMTRNEFTVTFTVTDGANALEGALVSFNGTTGTTDVSGITAFAEVSPAADMAYTITLDGYEDVAGTATVVDQDVSVSETMTRNEFTVTFNVTDGTNALEGAVVSFNGTTVNTDASGGAAFAEVSPAADMAYTITLDGYTEVTGTVTVADQDLSVDESMSMILYSVTFNVTDGTNPLEGATVTFDGADMQTDASGVAVFTDIAPATGVSYSVSLDYRYYDDNGTVDVDGDETVDVTLALTAISNSLVESMNVYPNPTSGSIYIEGVEAGAAYEIYNITQQKIAEGILDGSQVNLNVKAGLYILKVASNGETFVNRLVVK